MAKKHVRARLVSVEASDEAENLEDQLMLDVIIDSESRLILGTHPIFGVYGPPRGGETFPFIMRMDGSLDFGAWAEPEDRFEQTNLRERPIRVGEYATYEARGDEWICRVVEVIDLANNQPV
jgi:hypothetical protein